jgi:hypothetical protein
MSAAPILEDLRPAIFGLALVLCGCGGGGGGGGGTKSDTPSASNPMPSIASLTPASEAAGTPAFTLSVSGSGFIAASSIKWNGTALVTTYVGASQLTAPVPAGNIAGAGSASITVFNPTPGGGTATAMTFTIDATNPVPSLTSLSPSSAVFGSAASTLTVSGSGFVAASAVNWNGAALATTYVSAAQLTAVIPAADLVSASTVSVTVDNPVPGGGTSNAATFTISGTNPLPWIVQLSPAHATAGAAALTLAVGGSNFIAASTVNWMGTALTTTFVSASQLTALVPASNLTGAGTAGITVVNPAPGGGASDAATFTINPAIAGAYIRQFAQYTPLLPGDNSPAWTVTLNGVQAGSTIYVVGTWPNFSNTYPTMGVTDSGSNTYTLLDRYDDKTILALGVQGSQSMGHWYAANVGAGSYTINMSPTAQTFEDWVGLVAFEVAGVSSTPLGGHTLNFQAGVPPGTDSVNAAATSTNSSGILIAFTFDDVDATAPTGPLAGSGLIGVGSFWDFTRLGRPAASAEYAIITSSGAHTATFSPQEAGAQAPDYMTSAAIFQ